MLLSRTSKVIVSLILFYELCVNDAEGLDYTYIGTLGMSCFPKDSCDRNIELPFGSRSCECDNACDKFNDCCINAPSNRRISQDGDAETATDFECLAYESALGVYAIMKCPTDYKGLEEVISKCENVEDISDPLAASTVTDIAFNITYKNHYCAQCHNAEAKNLRTWDIIVDCDAPSSISGKFLVNATYVEEHFIFVNNSSILGNGEWGFYYPDDEQSAERNFYTCNLSFRPSDSLRPFVRLCRDDIISTCLQSYKRSRIIKACRSYMAVVEIAGKVYKNPHCAMCNDENIREVNKQTMCTITLNLLEKKERRRKRSLTFAVFMGRKKSDKKKERRKGLSFGVLVDVNTSDGEMVGLVRDDRCSGTDRWDPFAKKCRRTICAIPSWRVEFGKCVPP